MRPLKEGYDKRLLFLTKIAQTLNERKQPTPTNLSAFTH